MKIIKPLRPYEEPNYIRILRDGRNIDRLISNLGKELSDGTMNKTSVKIALENAISYGRINFKATPFLYRKLNAFYTEILGKTMPCYCAKAPRKIKEK